MLDNTLSPKGRKPTSYKIRGRRNFPESLERLEKRRHFWFSPHNTRQRRLGEYACRGISDSEHEQNLSDMLEANRSVNYQLTVDVAMLLLLITVASVLPCISVHCHQKIDATTRLVSPKAFHEFCNWLTRFVCEWFEIRTSLFFVGYRPLKSIGRDRPGDLGILSDGAACEQHWH